MDTIHAVSKLADKVIGFNILSSLDVTNGENSSGEWSENKRKYSENKIYSMKKIRRLVIPRKIFHVFKTLPLQGLSELR